MDSVDGLFQRTNMSRCGLESRRMRWGRMKPSREPWVSHRWPLVDLRMTRRDCAEWFASRYPERQLPRSACVICPYRSDKHWLELKQCEPDSFDEAVKFDLWLRNSKTNPVRALLNGRPISSLCTSSACHRHCRKGKDSKLDRSPSVKSVKDFVVSELHKEQVSPRYSLYPHQRQVLRDILHALSSPERRAVAHLPTGAGKTRIASHAACHLLNETEADGSLVIWLALPQKSYVSRRRMNFRKLGCTLACGMFISIDTGEPTP